MARPPKYTPDVHKRLTDAIRVGATYKLACDYAGVSEDTLSRWRDRYAGFAESLKEAEGTAVVGWLAKIEKAANDGQWTAAAWKLERRYPHEYGRTVSEHTGRDGGPIEVADVSDARERLAGRLDELAAKRAARSLAQDTHRTGS